MCICTVVTCVTYTGSSPLKDPSPTPHDVGGPLPAPAHQAPGVAQPREPPHGCEHGERVEGRCHAGAAGLPREGQGWRRLRRALPRAQRLRVVREGRRPRDVRARDDAEAVRGRVVRAAGRRDQRRVRHRLGPAHHQAHRVDRRCG